MAKRKRKRNPTGAEWAAIGVTTVIIGAVTYAIVRVSTMKPVAPIGPRPQPQPQPQPSNGSWPTPTPVPTPTPGPSGRRPDLCNPTDPTTWPAGMLCIHDGERFVYVDDDEEPTPLPAYETICDVEVDDDHYYSPTGAHPHGGLSQSQAAKLASAVALDKNGVSVRLASGKSIEDWFEHEHAVVLDQAQIDTLRSGSPVYVTSSYDNDHDHLVMVACESYAT